MTPRGMYYRFDPETGAVTPTASFSSASPVVRVLLDELFDGRKVSTAFLGLDHSFSDDSPHALVFETAAVVKTGGEWEVLRRHAEVDAARAYHARVLAALRAGLAGDAFFDKVDEEEA